MINIPGISKTSLWKAWKAIRGEFRSSSHRDVVDFLEYDIDPDVWINRLLRQIRSANYEPSAPTRYSVSKSNGFSRRMTLPQIPDLVLYRAIVDYLYNKAKRYQQEHVYFLRGPLSKRVRIVEGEARLAMASEYSVSRRSFLQWLRYDQYRKKLILEKTYPFIVITDITNFFDSVLHSHITEALREFATPSRMLGLLFFLLERFCVRDEYSDSPRIGLPIDEFDCSRTIAHLVLFPHDVEMNKVVGKNAYVRWMDDQNMGVSSRAEGLRTLAEVQRSLANLHLTPNAKKSVILTLTQARRHFHLDLNKMLDRAGGLPSKTVKDRRALGAEVRRIWLNAKSHEGVGEWEKILKRMYLFAGKAGSRFMRYRALADLLERPTLTKRIADYMRCTGNSEEYVDFILNVMNHEEQIYADVNVVLIDSLLRLEVGGVTAARIRQLAVDLLSGKLGIPGQLECAAIAPLIILRFGDRRSLRLFETTITSRADKVPYNVIRSTGLVFSGYGLDQFRTLRRTAARLLRGNLGELVRFVERIISEREVPNRFMNRLVLRYDAVGRTNFVDMRTVASARLLALNRRVKVTIWLANWRSNMIAKEISDFDKALLRRLF